MSIIRVSGCCGCLVDIDYYSGNIVYESDTGLYWHRECAFKEGRIEEKDLADNNEF